MLIRLATPADFADIDLLLDAAFGLDRHARTASRLRAGAAPLVEPSLVARGDDGELLGSVQYWPLRLVAVRSAAASSLPLTLLGPVAVAATARSIGLGRRLIAASLAVVDAAGIDPVLLIGDESYYGRFGFGAAATAGWQLPGPVERHRLLLRQRIAHRMPHDAVVAPVAAMNEVGAAAA